MVVNDKMITWSITLGVFVIGVFWKYATKEHLRSSIKSVREYTDSKISLVTEKVDSTKKIINYVNKDLSEKIEKHQEATNTTVKDLKLEFQKLVLTQDTISLAIASIGSDIKKVNEMSEFIKAQQKKMDELDNNYRELMMRQKITNELNNKSKNET